MDKIITDPGKDPMGAMLLDTFHGDESAYLEVSSPVFEMSEMRGAEMMRSHAAMNRLEKKALSLCTGKVLDVGAGGGCHSRHLLEQGMEVEAIDISPGCVEVMQRQGIKAYQRNIFAEQHGRFDTVLMLMNGLGICGTLDGLNLFFQHVPTFLGGGGKIVADSTDLRCLMDEEQGFSDYYGETEFVMRYKGIKSAPFSWLYVDFETLQHLARHNNLQCEQVLVEPPDHYLVEISVQGS